MSGTDRLFVVTIIIRQVAKQQIHTTLVIVRACYDLLTTSNMEDGLAGMEIDCATIHQSDTST